MEVRTLFFASHRDLLGLTEIRVALPSGARVIDLIEDLRGRGGSFSALPTNVAVAVNHRYAAPDDLLEDGDEVALIPPVAGGMGTGRVYVELTSDRIDLSDWMGRVGGAEDGAAILFVGAVRNHNDGRSVEYVEYEAYEPMARTLLTRIAEEGYELLGTGRVAVVHRVGWLGVGEVSVAIAVSSPHRAEAYAASRYIIEEIKKRLPIWKRESYEGGETEWTAGREPEPLPEPRPSVSRGEG